MDDIGDVVGGVVELGGAIVEGVASSGGNRGRNNDGCFVFLTIFLVIGLIFGGIAMCAKSSKVPDSPKTIPPEQFVGPLQPKETLSHKLGRKTKESVIEFGKGLIGK